MELADWDGISVIPRSCATASLLRLKLTVRLKGRSGFITPCDGYATHVGLLLRHPTIELWAPLTLVTMSHLAGGHQILVCNYEHSNFGAEFKLALTASGPQFY